MKSELQLKDRKLSVLLSRKDIVSLAGEEKVKLFSLAAEGIMNKNTSFRKALGAGLCYPDGEGAVMLLKKKGLPASKIPGVELWLDVVCEYYTTKSFFLLGASPEVLRVCKEKLKEDFPGIDIRACRDGFFKEEDKEEIFNVISEKEPDIVFVATGQPAQEILIDQLYSKYPATYMGLGGSFDIYSGSRKRAPEFWIRNRMEWFYRLIRQPGRIVRQMVLLKFWFKLKLGRI